MKEIHLINRNSK